jgi:hypothetical protein
MKTPAEIHARIEELSSGTEDYLGFQRNDLINALTFEEARRYLKDDVTDADGEKWQQDTDSLREAHNYAPFAWDKANSNRGLSAGRSIEHYKAWLWLLGHDQLASTLDDHYEYYGKPCLVLVCEFLDIPWDHLDDGRWVNNEFDEGIPSDERTQIVDRMRSLAAHYKSAS